ncbi:hypothetical protein EV360DRAFT_66343 [Lentinula raphanica]|nr:hypothetical protein EV360DRAFT_66343 [Lentinula raphanica]
MQYLLGNVPQQLYSDFNFRALSIIHGVQIYQNNRYGICIGSAIWVQGWNWGDSDWSMSNEGKGGVVRTALDDIELALLLRPEGLKFRIGEPMHAATTGAGAVFTVAVELRQISKVSEAAARLRKNNLQEIWKKREPDDFHVSAIGSRTTQSRRKLRVQIWVQMSSFSWYISPTRAPGSNPYGSGTKTSWMTISEYLLSR